MHFSFFKSLNNGINVYCASNNVNWRPPSLSELTPYYIPPGLTHLVLEAYNFMV